MGKKGIKFERDLVHKFWDNGFAALRSAGSGAARYPMPDIVAGNGSKFIAIEVKKRANFPVYLTNKEIKELAMFTNLFGAEAFVGVKIPRLEWRFIKIEDLKESGENYKVDEETFESGLEFEDIINSSYVPDGEKEE